jgi:hypothetical protein
MEVFERRLSMKPAAALSFAVLSALIFGSITLAAQTYSQNQKSYGVARMEGPGAPNTMDSRAYLGCPVSLHAQHGADGNMLNVDKSRPKGLAQLLHLTLINPDSRQIVKANLRIHGLSGKGRITQASAQNNSDKVETLVVTFTPSRDKAVSGDLWVPGMTAVLSIDLNSVTYADGSTRSFSERELCRVAPDPLMLIAGR